MLKEYFRKLDWSHLTILCTNPDCPECQNGNEAITRTPLTMNFIGSTYGNHWYECPRCSHRRCLASADGFTTLGYTECKKPLGKWSTACDLLLFIVVLVSILPLGLAFAAELFGGIFVPLTSHLLQGYHQLPMSTEELHRTVTELAALQLDIDKRSGAMAEGAIKYAAGAVLVGFIIKFLSERFPAVQWKGNKDSKKAH